MQFEQYRGAQALLAEFAAEAKPAPAPFVINAQQVVIVVAQSLDAAALAAMLRPPQQSTEKT